MENDDLERFHALVELSNDFIAMADFDGTVTYLNRAGRALVGLETDAEALGRPTDDFFTEAGRGSSVAIEEAVRELGYWQGESELRHFPTGGSIPVSVNSFLVTRSSDGVPLALATVQRDLRARIEAESTLAAWALEQRQLAALGRMALSEPLRSLAAETVLRLDERFVGMASAVLAVDAGRRLRPLATSSGAARSDAVPLASLDTVGRAVLEDSVVAAPETEDAMPYEDLALGDGIARAVLACPIPGSEGVWGSMAVFSPEEHAWTPDEIAFAEAVSAVLGAAVRRSELEEKLEHQVLHDGLTGLPNRALAADRMESALRRAQRHDAPIAVLLLDLDDFKGINDTLGHAVGDQLLGEIARRLQRALPRGDTVARLGGDEFVVIIDEVAGSEQALALAGRLLAACSEPIILGEARCEVTTSIGVTVAQGDADPNTLLAEADIAMYRAKRDQPGSCRLFDKTMRAEVLDKVNLSTELRTAVADGSVEVWYQPILEARSGKVVALEALARWRDRSGVMVPPHSFIPLAEETGIILQLGRAVLEQAVTAAVGWRRARPDIVLRVNASAHELRDPMYADRVDAIRAAGGLPTSHLGIEITESVLVDEGKHSQGNLQRLKELGIGLLLDDFGTGYSSLSYLQRFPDIDVLKIDRVFLHDEVRGAAILAALIGLGGAFGFRVCAEGVETLEQHQLLVRLGCDLAQGFLFAKPVPASELDALLDELDDRFLEGQSLTTT